MQIYLTKPIACSILQVEIVDIITLERRSRMREGASGSGTVANLATGSSGTFVVASSSSRMQDRTAGGGQKDGKVRRFKRIQSGF